jgi:hypothetical protein
MGELEAYRLYVLLGDLKHKQRPALCHQIPHQSNARHPFAGTRHTCKQGEH